MIDWIAKFFLYLIINSIYGQNRLNVKNILKIKKSEFKEGNSSEFSQKTNNLNPNGKWGKQNENHNSFSWHWNQLYSLSKGANTIWQMILFCSHHLKDPNKWIHTHAHTHTFSYINEDGTKNSIFLYKTEIEIVTH